MRPPPLGRHLPRRHRRCHSADTSAAATTAGGRRHLCTRCHWCPVACAATFRRRRRDSGAHRRSQPQVAAADVAPCGRHQPHRTRQVQLTPPCRGRRRRRRPLHAAPMKLGAPAARRWRRAPYLGRARRLLPPDCGAVVPPAASGCVAATAVRPCARRGNRGQVARSRHPRCDEGFGGGGARFSAFAGSRGKLGHGGARDLCGRGGGANG